MPKTNKPKRKPLIVRLTAEERERLEIIGLYFNEMKPASNQTKLAGAARAAIKLAYNSIRLSKQNPDDPAYEHWDEK
jgi:hypothetical protein